MHTRVPMQFKLGGDQVPSPPPPFWGGTMQTRTPSYPPRPRPLRLSTPAEPERGGDEDGGTMRVHGVIVVLGTLLVLATAQRRK